MTPDNTWNEIIHHYHTPRGVRRRTFVIVTVLLSVALLMAVAGWISSIQDRDTYRRRMSNVYMEAYLDLLDGINDIEVSLEKVEVSSTHSYQVDTLEEIHLKASMLVSSLSRLSLYDTTTYNSIKYLNQVGDYAYYLATRLTREGDTLSSSEKNALSSLCAVSRSIGTTLKDNRDNIQNAELLLNNSQEGLPYDTLDSVDTSIDYPSLIYDGPFSDSRQTKTPLGIVGNTISTEQALDIAKASIPDRYRDALHYVDTHTTTYESYYFANDSGEVSVNLTTTGQIISMDIPYEEGDKDISADECVDLATRYLESIGYKDMREVWCSIYYGTAYVNYVYESEGVLIYPDMVKVKVSMSSGEVIGVESTSYIYCHTHRDIPSPILDEEEILLSIPDMSNVSTRLVLIPKDNDEILCYEVYGEIGDSKYFVYYDASTGMEINILKVIDSDNGEVLL